MALMVTLGQLWARSELDLEIVVDPPGARDAAITIVHSSELPEVDEWLAGGEVLLTIGVGQDLSADTVGDYVARLKVAGIHALGIGLGSDLPSQAIPPTLISHARQHELALFGVPEPVPFIAVVDAFTRMREEETNRELTRASSAGRRFATELTQQGPAALVRDLAETLATGIQFVSPTGRSLIGAGPTGIGRTGAGLAGAGPTGASLSAAGPAGVGSVGGDAPAPVRRELIAESLKPSLAPRLLRTENGIVEAVPVGDGQVRGWILAPAEAAGSPRTRSLLLSTAAALLGLSVSEDPPRREESQLFASPMTTAEARVEWSERTGTAPVSRVKFTVFGGVRGDGPEALLEDLGGATLLARAGSTLGVVHMGESAQVEDEAEPATLVDRVAEVTGLDELFAKMIPLSQVHHTWTVWRTQHEASNSDVRALLSSIDESAARRFTDRTLGGLLAAKDGQDLLLTLRAFIAAGGVRDTVATDLGIHRHTVRARMAKIEKILDRDLSRSESVQAVALALELAEM